MKKIILLVAVLVIGLAAYRIFRPLPALEPVSQIPQPPKTTAISLPWAAGGQSAIGASGYGVLEAYNTAAPVPVASVAKVITALAVLQQKPLAAGSQGPSITLDTTDLGYLDYYYKNDGSVVKVAAGEQISEYQALQAMLLPSANNMADSLARWAFGSPADYVTYANGIIKKMGLSHTVVGNTNGFDDTTTSTADDLVMIGLQAMRNPVIADIVSQSTAAIPVQGQIKNVNFLLGSNGVVGIKTGNTDKAGGCYLFAAKHTILGKQVTVVGAVLGQPSLVAAVPSGRNLLNAADSGFQQVTAVSKNQLLGSYAAPWGASAELKTNKDLSLVVWKGKDIKIINNVESAAAPQSAGTAIGSVSVESSGQSVSSPLYLTQNLLGPSLSWRIFN
jgi:D-alanyl-D-alanine carboxypeptidase (penicillin-binding protein 5/6)